MQKSQLFIMMHCWRHIIKAGFVLLWILFMKLFFILYLERTSTLICHYLLCSLPVSYFIFSASIVAQTKKKFQIAVIKQLNLETKHEKYEAKVVVGYISCWNLSICDTGSWIVCLLFKRVCWRIWWCAGHHHLTWCEVPILGHTQEISL